MSEPPQVTPIVRDSLHYVDMRDFCSCMLYCGEPPKGSSMHLDAYGFARRLYQGEEQKSRTVPLTFRILGKEQIHFMQFMGHSSSYFRVLRGEQERTGLPVHLGYALGVGVEDVDVHFREPNAEFFSALKRFSADASRSTFFGIETIVAEPYRRSLGLGKKLTLDEMHFAQELGFEFFAVLAQSAELKQAFSRHLGTPVYTAKPSPCYPHELLLYRV